MIESEQKPTTPNSNPGGVVSKDAQRKTTVIANDNHAVLLMPDLLDRIYRWPQTGRYLERIKYQDLIKHRGEQLMALVAELDEAVCDEKPHSDLREYLDAIEYIAEELQAICLRYDLRRE